MQRLGDVGVVESRRGLEQFVQPAGKGNDRHAIEHIVVDGTTDVHELGENGIALGVGEKPGGDRPRRQRERAKLGGEPGEGKPDGQLQVGQLHVAIQFAETEGVVERPPQNPAAEPTGPAGEPAAFSDHRVIDEITADRFAEFVLDLGEAFAIGVSQDPDDRQVGPIGHPFLQRRPDIDGVEGDQPASVAIGEHGGMFPGRPGDAVHHVGMQRDRPAGRLPTGTEAFHGERDIRRAKPQARVGALQIENGGGEVPQDGPGGLGETPGGIHQRPAVAA